MADSTTSPTYELTTPWRRGPSDSFARGVNRKVGAAMKFAKLHVGHPFVDHVFNEYLNETNKYARLCLWGQLKDPKALILFELFTQPGEMTVDLLCAQPGNGFGSNALYYAEHCGRQSGCRISRLNSLIGSWQFYWSRGYRLDFQDTAFTSKRLAVTKRSQLAQVQAFIEQQHPGEGSIPMCKPL